MAPPAVAEIDVFVGIDMGEQGPLRPHAVSRDDTETVRAVGTRDEIAIVAR